MLGAQSGAGSLPGSLMEHLRTEGSDANGHVPTTSLSTPAVPQKTGVAQSMWSPGLERSTVTPKPCLRQSKLTVEEGGGSRVSSKSSKGSHHLEDTTSLPKVDVNEVGSIIAGARADRDRQAWKEDDNDLGPGMTTAPSTGPGLLKEDEDDMLSRPSVRDASKIPSLRGSRSRMLSKPDNSGPWLLRAKENLRATLESPAFELSVSIIIVLNTAVMGFEAQYVGIEQGNRLGFPSTIPASEQIPWGEGFLYHAELVFGSVFTLEMCLKLLGFGRRYFCEVWNWLDFMIVMGWLLTLQGDDLLPISPVMLRAFRTVRVLRLIRLTRSLHSLDSLYTMMMALQGSMSIIAWSSVVLLLMQAMVAILLTGVVEDFIDNDENDFEDRKLMFEYFGTFTRALLSVFEITLANWPTPVRLLTTRINEWLMPFLVSYVFLVGFGVVRVITGVFVTVTFYVAEHDDEIMIRRRVTAQTRHKAKMAKLFKAADSDGSGQLDRHEFCNIFQDMKVQTWLGAMEFGMSLYGTGPDALFSLLEKDAYGQVDVGSLTTGVARLKGYAKSFTLAMVMHDVKLAMHRSAQVGRALAKVEQQVKTHCQPRKGITWGEITEIEGQEESSGSSADEGRVKDGKKRKFSFRMPKNLPHLRSMRTVAAMDSKSTIEKKLFHGNLEGRIDVEDDDDNNLRVFLHNLAVSAVFELTFMGLIMVQAVIVCLQTQYRGIELGYEIQYKGMGRPARESWPGAEEAFTALDWTFGIAFCLELVLKILGLRRLFFRSGWNYLDIFATIVWILELSASALPPVLRATTVRTVRLLRLARLLKLFKTRKEFRDVQLLWAALRGSFLSLFWSIILMFILLVMTGLLIPSIVGGGYLEDHDQPAEDRKIVHDYFGTFTKSLLTMFELSLANWMIPTRILTEKVSEWYILYSIPHRLVIGFAMVTVLGAVFIQETFQIAKNDNAVQLNMRNRIIKHHIAKMQMFFEEADADGSGVVDRAEFMEIVSKPGMSLWLSAMGLDVQYDSDTLFQLIDNGDEQLTATELLEGVARMKGHARNIDLTILQSELLKLGQLLTELRSRTKRMNTALGKEDRRVRSKAGRRANSGASLDTASKTSSAEDEAGLSESTSPVIRPGKCKRVVSINQRRESFDQQPPGENDDPFMDQRMTGGSSDPFAPSELCSDEEAEV